MISFVVLPFLFSSSILYYLQDNVQWLEQDVIRNLVVFYLFTSITMAFALTPTTFIAILSGYFFSWWSLIGVVVSYLIASVLGLLLGKGLSKGIVGGYLADEPKLQAFFEKLKERELLMVIFGRLSPILPFAMMNVAFSSVRISWGSYLLGSLLGMLPRTVIFFYTGKTVEEIWVFLDDPSLEGIYAIIPAVLIVISSIGILWLLNKAAKEIK